MPCVAIARSRKAFEYLDFLEKWLMMGGETAEFFQACKVLVINIRDRAKKGGNVT